MKITKNNYKSVVYISHGYGGKEENLEKITKILQQLTELYPEHLFLSPVHMWHEIYHITDYEQGLNMCLCLLQELADEMWVCDNNYSGSRGCIAEINYCRGNKIPYKFVDASKLNA